MKTKTAHTPGPWRANGRIVEQFNSVLGVGLRPLASLPEYEEARTNACLIAAAPDLLDAAKLAVNAAEFNGQERDWVGALRVAISKAEG